MGFHNPNLILEGTFLLGSAGAAIGGLFGWKSSILKDSLPRQTIEVDLGILMQT
jgi:hypothetical protein